MFVERSLCALGFFCPRQNRRPPARETARSLRSWSSMDIADLILARRSVRSYSSQPIEDPLVESLLQSAVQAPSAMNAQPWLFAVVQDRALLKRYSDRAKQLLTDRTADRGPAQLESMLREESFNIFYDAGTLITIGCAARERFSEADCWLAAENLMLAARSAGLGSCCIGFALDLLNTDEVKVELGMPAVGVIVAAIILGYPAALPPPVARAAPKVTAWLRNATASKHGAGLRNDAERYAREHPAGYLASRPAPPVTERVGHPLVRDDPGFGACGHRQLAEGPRELTLGTPLPEVLVNRRAPASDAVDHDEEQSPQ